MFQHWLVVEPTHLKNMLVKMDHFPQIFGMEIQKIFELTSPRAVVKVNPGGWNPFKMFGR